MRPRDAFTPQLDLHWLSSGRLTLSLAPGAPAHCFFFYGSVCKFPVRKSSTASQSGSESMTMFHSELAAPVHGCRMQTSVVKAI